MDAAAVAGALSVIFGFVALATRLRPVRWLGRRLVTVPFGDWVARTVRAELDDALVEVRAELTFNGGSSLKDQVTRLVRHMEGDTK